MMESTLLIYISMIFGGALNVFSERLDFKACGYSVGRLRGKFPVIHNPDRFECFKLDSVEFIPRCRQLRLRGGGFLERCSACFPCFGCCFQGQDQQQDSSDQSKTKRRVGKMSDSLTINANIKKVYKVISDIDHYQDWSGDGIKTISILERGKGHTLADYICGSFGLTFHFAVQWTFREPAKVTFRNAQPTGLVHMLKGEYTLTEQGPDATLTHFFVTADMRGPIPHIIKLAIAKLLVHIALRHLKSYVESPQCDINLRRYEGESLTRRLTQLVTRVPNFVSHLNLSRGPPLMQDYYYCFLFSEGRGPPQPARRLGDRLALETLRVLAALALVRRWLS